MGRILTENRNGLIVAATLTEANTREEWTAAIELLAEQSVRPAQTVGADKDYDLSNFVDPCRELGLTPHVAMQRQSRIDQRTAGHAGYKVSQTRRKQVEEPFGWMKTYGLLGKLRHRGREDVDWLFRLTATAYNITRMKTLMA